LADPNTRQGKRTPVTLKIKFKSETLEQFIERYAVDVSQGGIFIRTKEPLAVGTQMKFEFQLRDASPLIAGEGTVVWTRENDPSRPAIAPGMGVRFDRLADGSQAVLERILAEKAKQAPQRAGQESPTKPPLFTDTPTKVAPAPVQEALGLGTRRPRSDSQETPLPPPRPFHSDADDFDEKAFEEATKVRSLDELAAQTAGLVSGNGASTSEEAASDDAPTSTAIQAAPEELAPRRNGRADSTLSDPPPPATATPSERESAPGLPEPPSTPKLDAPSRPADEPKPKPGIEPAKAHTRPEAPPRAAAEAALPIAPPRKSAAPLVIFLLVLVAGAAGAVWWFVLRDDVAEQVAQQNDDRGSGSASVVDQTGSGSASVVDQTGSGSASVVDQTGSGSASVVDQTGSGSASVVDQTGSGSAGSATVEPPKAAIVDTVIASSVAKGATVEIVGTDQKGPAPFTAKLERDKTYTARVTAPGFRVAELEIKGGQDKATAKLVAKPRVITVVTDPPGADIYVDNVNTQKVTPSEVELTAAQAAKPRVRISLRRPGFRPVDQMLDASAFKDGEKQMLATINAKLAVMQRPTGGGTSGGGTTGGGTTGGGTTGGGTTGGGTTGGGTTGGNAGSATTGGGSGSATTPTGGGSGSATTPSGGGSGSATTTTGGGSGSASPATGGTGGGTTGGGTTGSASKPTNPTGTGSAAKPPASGSAAPSSTGASGTGAAPSTSSGEPAPTWAK
jgi:uncharacterized protein (TIGR02266 family)